METCQHLIFKKGGGCAACGKPAKYLYLGEPVCSRHSPEHQDALKEQKNKKNQAAFSKLAELLITIEENNQ